MRREKAYRRSEYIHVFLYILIQKYWGSFFNIGLEWRKLMPFHSCIISNDFELLRHWVNVLPTEQRKFYFKFHLRLNINVVICFNIKKRCVLKASRQKWKHFEEMFVRTLHYHQLNSSCLQTIIYRKFCKHSQIYSE